MFEKGMRVGTLFFTSIIFLSSYNSNMVSKPWVFRVCDGMKNFEVVDGVLERLHREKCLQHPKIWKIKKDYDAGSN